MVLRSTICKFGMNETAGQHILPQIVANSLQVGKSVSIYSKPANKGIFVIRKINK